LRGITKVNIEALLRATGQNIKQLLKGEPSSRMPKPTAPVEALVPVFSVRYFSLSLLHWASALNPIPILRLFQHALALTFIESDDLRTIPVGIMSFSSALRTEYTVVMAGLVITALPIIGVFLIAQG
jgi:hypothetical protein